MTKILYNFFTDILVGFDGNFTSVNESVGSFELCVEIFTDPSLLPSSFDFNLDLVTIPGTAGIQRVNNIIADLNDINS